VSLAEAHAVEQGETGIRTSSNLRNADSTSGPAVFSGSMSSAADNVVVFAFLAGLPL